MSGKYRFHPSVTPEQRAYATRVLDDCERRTRSIRQQATHAMAQAGGWPLEPLWRLRGLPESPGFATDPESEWLRFIAQGEISELERVAETLLAFSKEQAKRERGTGATYDE